MLIGSIVLSLISLVCATLTRAITTYVDMHPKFLRQVRGLWASWYTVRTTHLRPIDLILFVAPGVDKLLLSGVASCTECALVGARAFNVSQSECWIFVLDLSEANNYAFAKSLDYVVHNSTQHVLSRYSMVMKTDADTFVTPHFARWLPSPPRFFTGRGAYATDYYTRHIIAKWAARLNFTHRGMHDLGATWYAPPDQLVTATRVAADLTRVLRRDAFTPNSSWPRWHRGVASMYAQEIAVNHLYADVVPLIGMDHNTNADFDTINGVRQRNTINNIYHLHTYHTSRFFSKFKFEARAYDHLNTSAWDSTDARVWCLVMALRGNRINGHHVDDYIATWTPHGAAGPVKPPPEVVNGSVRTVSHVNKFIDINGANRRVDSAHVRPSHIAV